MAVLLPLLWTAATAVAESGVVAAVGGAITSAATTAAGFLGVGGAAAPALGAAAPALGAAAPALGTATAAQVAGSGLTSALLAGQGAGVLTPFAAQVAAGTVPAGTAGLGVLTPSALAAGGGAGAGAGAGGLGLGSVPQLVQSGMTAGGGEYLTNTQRAAQEAARNASLTTQAQKVAVANQKARYLSGGLGSTQKPSVNIPMNQREGANLLAGTGQYTDYTPIGQDMGYSFASTDKMIPGGGASGSDPRSVLTGGWASGSDVTGGMSDAEVLSQPFSGATQTPHGDPAGYEALKQSLGTWDVGDGAPGWEGRVSEPFGMDDLWGAVEGSGEYLWGKGGDLWEGMKKHPGPTIFGLAALDQLLARREADERMKGEKKRKQELAARYPIYGGYRGEGIARQEPYWVSDPSWNRRIG